MTDLPVRWDWRIGDFKKWGILVMGRMILKWGVDTPLRTMIWQKVGEMIFEIIFSKTECRIFLIFCYSHFINNFVVKNIFLEP